MKRVALAVLAVVVLAALLVFAFRKTLTLGAMERVVANNMLSSVLDDLDDGLHVIVCGAGSPLPDLERSGPCTAVIAGDQLWIVDAGSGASRMLGRLRVPQGRIEGVLLTHFHSDHIDGLGELLLQRWINATATEPVPLYGPTGIAAIANGLRTAYLFDTQWRTEHHGEDVAPSSGAGATPEPHRIDPRFLAKPIIQAENGLTIHAIRVDHKPVQPAFGYRFDYKGRAVVISGDTSPSDGIRKGAIGADVLIHEALAPQLVEVMTRAAEKAERANLVKITKDILDYHTTPVEAAEIAAEAEVPYLVYHHIVPPLPLAPMEEIFVEGVSEVYDGSVTVAKDGLMISLPPKSDVVEMDWLL